MNQKKRGANLEMGGGHGDEKIRQIRVVSSLFPLPEFPFCSWMAPGTLSVAWG